MGLHTEQGKPVLSFMEEESQSQDWSVAVRVWDAGKSEGRAVMARIGVESRTRAQGGESMERALTVERLHHPARKGC